MAQEGRGNRQSVRFRERESTVPSASFIAAVEDRVHRGQCCKRCTARVYCGALIGVLCFPIAYVVFTEVIQPEPVGCVDAYLHQDDSSGPIYPPPRLGKPTAHEIPLSEVPDASAVGVSAADVLSWAERRTKAAQHDFVGGERLPSPDDWSSSIIYEIQVDRFNNGNTSNDFINLEPRQRKAGSVFMTGFRHGGDIWGIRERLPYLKDLGVNTLVLTPIFAHNGEYHGFGTTDVTKIDEGFGSNEEYRLFVRNAHSLGMRVIMDVVVNHIFDRESHYDVAREVNSFMVQTCAQALHAQHWQGQLGVNAEEQGTIMFSHVFFPPFRRQAFFNRCGPLAKNQLEADGPTAVYGDHAAGYYDYDTRNPEFHALFTEFLKWWVAFADVDGFRLDAARHVTDDFIAYFSTHTREFARSLGKDNFLVVGDVASEASDATMIRKLGSAATDPRYPTFVDAEIGVPVGVTRTLLALKDTYRNHSKFPMPGLNSIYNVKASNEFIGMVAGKCVADCTGEKMQSDMSHVVEQLPGYDCCTATSSGCTAGLTQLWTHIGIHNSPRFQHHDPHNMDLSIAGFAYLMTQPGQPVIYYGQEMGLSGICPSNMEQDTGEAVPEAATAVHYHCRFAIEDTDFYRQDMFATGPFLLGSSVRGINKRAYAGRWIASRSGYWESDPMLDRSHNLYQMARKLIKLRSSCPVLQTGQIHFHKTAHWSYGVMAFSRVSHTPVASEALVIINPSREVVTLRSFQLDSSVNPAAGDVFKTYVNVLNGETLTAAPDDGKLFLNLHFQLPAYGFAIFMDQSLVRMDQEYKIMTCAHPFEQVSAEPASNDVMEVTV